MSKRKLITILLLTAFAFSVTDKAEAQFLKKLFGKGKHHKTKDKEAAKTETATEEVNPEDSHDGTSTVKESKKDRKKRKKKEKKEQKEKEQKERKGKKDGKKKKSKKSKNAAEPAKTNAVVVKKWADLEYPASRRKKHYRVDILAPLYLDELVKNGYVVRDIPEKAIAGLNFYKGVQLASDSLKKAQFDVDIYIHDVASLLESTDMLLSKNMLDSSDLIIGAVNAKDVPALAAYAKKRKINFISAWSGSDGNVKDNQFFTMLQPSIRTHCEWVGNAVQKELQNKKALMLYRTTSAQDVACSKYFFSNNTLGTVQFSSLLCNAMPKKEAIAALIDTAHTVTLIIPITDNNYADSILKMLNRSFPHTHFHIYGMPGWRAIANIHKDGVYDNLDITITQPFVFDSKTDNHKYVETAFAREYGGKPEEFVYRGYEVTFWYVNMLKRHGTIFNRQYDDVEVAPFTKFEIRPQWDDNGNMLYEENRNLSPVTYECSKQKAKK